jgi:hypothetical protein
MSIKKKTTHGGKRKGSGRKAATDPKVKIWVSVRASQVEIVKPIIQALVEKFNKTT